MGTLNKQDIQQYVESNIGTFHEKRIASLDNLKLSKILKRKNENVNIKFIFEMMQMINFEAYDHKRYWISEYQEIELKLPSLQEQQKIADGLSTADREIELLKKELEELKKQKKGLMQRLLSGEVRVKV